MNGNFQSRGYFLVLIRDLILFCNTKKSKHFLEKVNFLIYSIGTKFITICFVQLICLGYIHWESNAKLAMKTMWCSLSRLHISYHYLQLIDFICKAIGLFPYGLSPKLVVDSILGKSDRIILLGDIHSFPDIFFINLP